MNLRKIAETRRLFVAVRSTTAGGLGGTALVIYQPLTGGWVGHEDQPEAIVLATFATFGGAAGHVKRIAKILDGRQVEWVAVSRREFDDVSDPHRIAYYKAIAEAWTKMVLAASREATPASRL